MTVRRWNGWGDAAVTTSVGPGAREALTSWIGPSSPPKDARIEDVLAALPASRLSAAVGAAGAGLSTEPEDRLRHARGQSLPDWIALRAGRVPAVPDAVARPRDRDDVRSLLDRSAREGWTLIPYGGGTSVVGGVTVQPCDRPVVTVATAGMTGLRSDLDERSGLATFGAGTTGPDVEAALAASQLTLGHYPQSFELSTVGGWVVTRSAGQESIGAGRIEGLFAGGHLEAPVGPLDLAPFPASAAGPDLREVVLGSEGRLGILTDVVVRASRLPARSVVRGYSVADEDRAFELGRTLARAGLPLRFVRVSSAAESATTFAQIEEVRRRTWLRRYLGWRGQGEGNAFVLVGIAGSEGVVRATEGEVARLVRAARGIGVPGLGPAWQRQRFASAYLRNALWDAGYALDTLETAAPWTSVPTLLRTLEGTLRDGLASDGERVLAFAHLSHAYPSGSSVYATYAYRLAEDPDETLDRWRRLKRAASEAIVANGGTISHQHGVGRDHAPYLPTEKGPLAMATLVDLARRFDPSGVMNRGVLLEDVPT